MVSAERYMARAMQLAKRGIYTADPNPCVGCVIVKNDQIVGEGWHQKVGENHAEINALTVAGSHAYGADCYVTLEPCSHTGRTAPCVDALIKAGIKRVFISALDPNPLVKGQGIARLKAADITVNLGILAEKTQALNIGFFHRMQLKRPYVRSKIAMSLDGRTATFSGESRWITGEAARQDVHKMRAQSSVILTGIGTVLFDDPALTVRPQGGWYPDGQSVRQPLRVVVDSQSRFNEKAKLCQSGEPILIATTVDKPNGTHTEYIKLPAIDNHADLSALMMELARRAANNVMVECGSALNGALLKAGLIDELIIYMAPMLMGDAAKGLAHLPDIHKMTQNISVAITDIRAVGQDWRITAIPEYKESTL